MSAYAIKLSEFPAWTIRANRADRFSWSAVAVDGDTIRIEMTGSLEDYEDAMERAGQLVLFDHPEPSEVAAVDAALREVLTATDRFWVRWSWWRETGGSAVSGETDLVVRARAAIVRVRRSAGHDPLVEDERYGRLISLGVAWAECLDRWGAEHGATLGCLLAIAREAWVDPGLLVIYDEGWWLLLGDTAREREAMGHEPSDDQLTWRMSSLDASSEFEAIVAAVEATPTAAVGPA